MGTLGAKAQGPVHVLLMGQYIAGNYDPGWPKFQEACLKQGVDIEVLTRDNDYPFYTSDMLKKFEVVIVCGLPDFTADTACSEAEMVAFRDRLNAYHRAGGGVLWAPLGFGGWGSLWTSAVGKRYEVGELFHCDDAAVRLSAVQDGADKLLLEIHNPTNARRTVRLTPAPGFAPLASLGETIELAPFSSEKRTLSTPAGSLDNGPYKGD